MPNSTVVRLDAAIAELRAQLADWPEQPNLATVRGEHITLVVDRDARLVELELNAGAKQSGLVRLGEQICDAQHRALDAFAGSADAEVELGGERRPISVLPHASGLPLLPPIPTQTDLDRMSAAFDALFEGRRLVPQDELRTASSELVSVEMTAGGRLVKIDFSQRAHQASRQELADGVLATAARARAELD